MFLNFGLRAINSSFEFEVKDHYPDFEEGSNGKG